MARILIDIAHPAHAHFFHHPARMLIEHGHEVLFTSRDKECARSIIESTGLPHYPLTSPRRQGFIGMARELIERDRELAALVRREKPDLLAALGGTFAAHAGRLTGTPSIVFYDTENARLQNLITYPFANLVVVPDCYKAWLPKHALRYAGYHELSYLHPRVFQPSRDISHANGLAENGDTFLVRVVSWEANHDIGETGWSRELLVRVVSRLSEKGSVLLSSEGELPPELAHHRYTGKPEALHHVMAFCRMLVGESATMASEAAVLGVPAIYAAQSGRGYTDDQEARYGLVRNIRILEEKNLLDAIESLLSKPVEHWQEQKNRLLGDCIDVARFVADTIEKELT